MMMKKITLLAAAVLLCVFGNTQLVQASSSTDAPTPTDAPVAQQTVDDKPKSTTSPQVQKLLAQYPRLVARIQYHGRVCFDGEECDITITALSAAVDGQPRDGKTIYSAVCATCHGTGLIGSPKLGDGAAWAPRIAKGKDTLYKNAINGFNAMPAKGGADLPDEEVQNAVDYMVSQAS